MSRKPSYRIHDGFRMPCGFLPEGFDSGRRYDPVPGDLFVVTYPKCGTTWVQHIVYLLVRRRPVAPDQSLTTLFPHLEEVGAHPLADLEPPRLIKTHLPFAMTPWSDAARYVLVVRNPFDCVVSFFYHTVGFPRHYDFADGDFATFFECFIEGEVDFGDYFDHLVPWVDAAERRNVLLVRYESLRMAPVQGIERIARFIGGKVAGFAEDPDALAWVVAESSLDSMARHQSRWSGPRPDALPFVRRGAVGGWRELFTPDQARRLADKLKARTRTTRAAKLWPDVVAAAEQL